jgi:hypothetical protein
MFRPGMERRRSAKARGRIGHVNATHSRLASSLATRVLLLLLCVPARGQTLSLPLKGYFHPGRAMPVQWDTSTETIQLSAPGAITSCVQTAGNPHGVFPWLLIDQNTSSSAATLPPLHPLEDSDCLVASTLNDDSPAAPLFPNRHVILLHPPNGIEGPAMAWETLDAILLTPIALAKISPQTQADLFAAGVELAVISDARPAGKLPLLSWRQSGRWWTASADLNLPPTMDSDAYAPTYGWIAGRIADFRLHIFLLGAIYCLLICGCALWRSRWVPAAIVVLSICAGLFFALDNRGYSPVFRRDGIVRLIDGTEIEDQWVYQVSHRDFEMKMPIRGSIRPIFFGPSQMQTTNLTIDFGDQGQPLAISGHLIADQPQALMTRRLQFLVHDFIRVHPQATPMKLLAADPIYRGFKLQGEFGAVNSPESWPGIVLRKP